MDQYDKKRYRKIATKIDEIAKTGNYGYEDYKEYLDEIVNDSQWSIYQEVLLRKYKIKDSHLISPVDAKERKIWDIIRFNTVSDFQKELKSLFDGYQLYQMGVKVYSATSSTVIGEIKMDTIIGLTNSIDYEGVVAQKGSTISTWANNDLSILSRYQEAINFLLD